MQPRGKVRGVTPQTPISRGVGDIPSAGNGGHRKVVPTGGGGRGGARGTSAREATMRPSGVRDRTAAYLMRVVQRGTSRGGVAIA